MAANSSLPIIGMLSCGLAVLVQEVGEIEGGADRRGDREGLGRGLFLFGRHVRREKWLNVQCWVLIVQV